MTTRVRGLKALLADTTNIPPTSPSKRFCSEKAKDMISGQLKMKAPRGQPYRQASIDDYTSSDISLKQVIDKRPEVIREGFRCIQEYTERNTSFAIQKATALQIFAGSVLRGSKIMEACDIAAGCTTFNSHTIQKWAKDTFTGYFATVSSIDDVTDDRLELELSSERGCYPKCKSLLSDENFRKEAKEYVLENGYVKGRPNLTLNQFVLWVKEQKSVDICTTTASLWLHDMGFSYKQFSKGVYFDGHERDDVVKEREVYLEKLQSYSHRMWTSHSPAPNPSLSPVIRVFHDESTFYANADQTFHWTDGSKQALKQKSLGQAVMVSDFIDEVSGFLEHDGEKARLLLEHQSEE